MATMKDIIQSPLLPALFGSMALGLFASSSSGSKVVKGGICQMSMTKAQTAFWGYFGHRILQRAFTTLK